MDAEKTGALIRKKRLEKGLTQVELGERIHISGKTVSKWERGRGAPEVSLLSELSRVLEVEVDCLLSGEAGEQHADNGSMKKMRFYVCPHCGSLHFHTGMGEACCCGQRLKALVPQKPEEGHSLTISKSDGDWFIEADHPMERGHYISFAAFVNGDTALIKKLYPQWDMQVRLPCFAHGMLVWYCTEHGLFYQYI